MYMYIVFVYMLVVYYTHTYTIRFTFTNIIVSNSATEVNGFQIRPSGHTQIGLTPGIRIVNVETAYNTPYCMYTVLNY